MVWGRRSLTRFPASWTREALSRRGLTSSVPALREVEVAGTDRASWQPQWNVINIQLQFVGALLGAYDPSKYTFYHSGQLQKAFQDYHQEWPSAGGGTRYAAACEFVRGVYDALHAHGVEVRDLI